MWALLKARKASEDQMEIFVCALQNACSEIIEKARRKRLCQSSVLEILHYDLIKTGLHH